MTFYRWLISLLCTAVVASSLTATADVRREIPARRPYITEIGEPYAISRAALDREAARMEELRQYLDNYGYPDYAEVQEIRPEWPWDSYEVRLYYLRRNVEVDFGRALTLPEAYPNLGLLKFSGGIPASKRLQIELALNPPESPAAPEVTRQPEAPLAAQPQKPSLEDLVARVEAAADRAAAAAEDAVRQSEAAERAANRTVEIVDQLLEMQQQGSR
ncbi:MAG: hypothetical protein N3C12_11830 [Candidatus Binatia bacterium]|nr:hypothetical protein [Candidatus Binatia bacterium]